MNEITIMNKDGKLTVSSLQVAADFEKRHDHIIRDIENLIAETSTQNSANLTTQNWGVKNFFVESTYINERGRAYKSYDITRDGFSLLVMGFTGKKALEWKLKYIKAFNLMEQKLKEQNVQTVDCETKIAEAILMNSKVHMSDQLLQLAKFDTLTKYNKNILIAKAAEILLGEPVLSFDDTENDAEPVVQMYSASEIGKMLGTTPQKIGRLASRNNMKTSEYGKLYNCTLSNGKNVNIFQYYQKAIDKFRELLKADNSEKSERKVESETNADIWTKFKKSNGAENI